MSQFDASDIERIGRVAKKGGAAGTDIKNLCVSAIRNAARKGWNRGSIGSSVLWAIRERFREVEGGLDVPNGTRIFELPNMIVPGMQMWGIYVETPRDGRSLTWNTPSSFESSCRSCRNPVPLGYRACGICGERVA